MSTLFTNATLLPCNETMDVIAPGWLLVRGATIAAFGRGAAPEGLEARERIDCAGDILMPGMVNPHAHLPMTLFRGLGEDVDDRLYRYVLPLERRFVSPRMVRIGTELACLELIASGVTTVADMYYFEAEVGRALDTAGLRGVVGQTLADFDPPDHRNFDEGFALVEDLVAEFRGHPRITPSIAPHAPYSTDVPVMARVAALAEANPDVPVQIHLAEMESENRWCADNHGLRPVQVVARSGLLRPGLICAHCLHVTEDDIAAMAKAGVTVAHNARSNAKAGRGIAPVEALRATGIPVGIATDGPMSGNTLDLFAQFGPVSMFAKLLGRSRAPMPARDVIRMATAEGASVLGLADRIGTLEPGKQADLIRVSLAAPRLRPVYDIYAALVFAAQAEDVTDTMVAGRWLMRARKLQTLDQTEILASADELASEFRAEMDRIDAQG